MKDRRWVRIPLTNEVVTQLLTEGAVFGKDAVVEVVHGLPEGAQFEGGFCDTRGLVTLYYSHDSFDPVPNGFGNQEPVLEIEICSKPVNERVTQELLSQLLECVVELESQLEGVGCAAGRLAKLAALREEAEELYLHPVVNGEQVEGGGRFGH